MLDFNANAKVRGFPARGLLCVRQQCRRWRSLSGTWAAAGKEGVQHADSDARVKVRVRVLPRGRTARHRAKDTPPIKVRVRVRLRLRGRTARHRAKDTPPIKVRVRVRLRLRLRVRLALTLTLGFRLKLRLEYRLMLTLVFRHNCRHNAGIVRLAVMRDTMQAQLDWR